jgi:hypothetical protein
MPDGWIAGSAVDLVLPAQPIAILLMVGVQEGVDDCDTDMPPGDALRMQAAHFRVRIYGVRGGIPTGGYGWRATYDVGQRCRHRRYRWPGQALNPGAKRHGGQNASNELEKHRSA